MGRQRRPKFGAAKVPQFFFSFTAAEGAAPPEGEGNPAEEWCFVSIAMLELLHSFIVQFPELMLYRM